MWKWILLGTVGLWWAKSLPRTGLKGCRGLGAARCPGSTRRQYDPTFPGKYGTGRTTGVDGIFSALEGKHIVEAP